MVKILKTSIFVLICFSLFAYLSSAEPAEKTSDEKEPAYLKTIPPDKLKEDLDFLFKTIEEVHPNMYAYTSKEEFAPLRDQLYKNINRPMTRLEFYKLTAPIVASLKNGHTFIQQPFTEFSEYIQKGGKIFPLDFYLDGESVFLSVYHGPIHLPIGGEVLTIDSQNAKEFLIKIARYFPSEGKAYSLETIQDKAPMYLWIEKGDAELLVLQIKAKDATAKVYKVKSLSYDEIVKSAGNKGKKANKTRSTFAAIYTSKFYSYYYSSEYNTGLIEFNMFHNMQQFKKFLKETFTKIRNQNVSNVIIDIRENPGGSSNLGDELLKYLTAKRFRQFEEIHIKISHQLFQAQSGLKKLHPDAAIGSTVTREEEFKQAEDGPLGFKGRVFVLIGPKSASSSVCFASAIKHFHIGTLIGQETIDTTVSYGDCIRNTVPNSGLNFSVACKYFVKAGGKPDGRGVLPDYEVKQTPEDTAKGVDTVLQFTLNLIKSGEVKK